ncbi:MAG: alpha-hydroxy-acid oxidizing protein, partial [Nitrososphaerales archaeon]
MECKSQNPYLTDEIYTKDSIENRMLGSQGSGTIDTSKTKRLPTCYEEWESEAKRTLTPAQFSFLYAGAGSDLTTRANEESFYKWRLVPRVLRNVEKRDLSIELFGFRFPVPFLLAPVGSQKTIHAEGELASARATAKSKVPFILSTASSFSIEEVASVMGSSPRWFQLYPTSDQEILASLLDRAKSSDYSAIVLTVDRAAEYPRYKLEHGHQSMGTANYYSDPSFNSKLQKLGSGKSEETDKRELLKVVSRTSSFSWKDVELLRNNTPLPLILKGVLHPSDAELALEHGVDGIIVSNHGGRRMDGEVAALDVLSDIVHVINRRIPVLMDSGIRGGVDVVKALALGADAILIGHLYAYAL